MYEPYYPAFAKERCNYMDKNGKKRPKKRLLNARMQKNMSNNENGAQNGLYTRMYHQECPYFLMLCENGCKSVAKIFLVWYDLCG